MFCHKCGSENLDSAKFCKSCGTSLTKVQNQIPRHELRSVVLRDKKKWNKKILVFIAGIILISLVALVGFRWGWFKSKNDEALIQQLVTQPQQEAPAPAPTPATQEPIESQPPEVPKTETYFHDARDFSDGVAWVKRETSSPWECIDNKGNTLFSLDEGSKPKTNFTNEGAIIETTDSNNKTKEEIIDKIGNVVFPKDDEYEYKIVDSYGNYHFVTRNINTFEKTEDQTGIVDNAGNWVLEPTGKLSVLGRELKSVGLIKVQKDGEEKYYDAQENDFFKTTDDYFHGSDIKELSDFWNSRVTKKFHQEDVLFVSPPDCGICTLGINYGDTSYKTSIYKSKLEGKEITLGFYDRNKNLMINLSSFNNPKQVGLFSNGYSSFVMENPQGNYFWTIIDKKGNKMFEPISDPIGKVSCGRVLVKPVNGDSEYYIDVNGKTIILDIEDGSDFDENCLAKIGNTSNDEGNQIYFIDTDGNIAF